MRDWWSELLTDDGLLLRDRALMEVDPDDVLTALRSGRLRRVQRGIYAPRDRELTALTLAHAGVISSGLPGAVASHSSAARVHGIEVPVSKVQHVTASRADRRRNRKDLHFHTRPFAVGDVLEIGGVPLSAIPRTLADLTTGLDRLEAVWALDDALRRGLATREQLGAVIEGWRGGAGCATAKIRLAESDGVAESILETAGRLALVDRGIKLPVPQYEIRTPSGILIARVDGAYLEERVVLEFDGAGVHGLPEAVFRDRWRQNGFPQVDWAVLRFTWWDVIQDPDGYAGCVERTLASRRAA